MDNVVLKSLSVENFFSFADGICFTTENDLGKKEFLENSFEQNDNSSKFSTKEIPLEVLAFLKLHFTDLLSEIPLHSETISKTQYKKILEKFVRQLNDREIFDRVFS